MQPYLLASRAFLSQRWVLWALFWSNALGTIYGYYWYKWQLIYTWNYHPAWQLVFVPDSPTASLFFTLALLFLLFPPKSNNGPIHVIRVIIEALAVVTSIKYGIWACAMIAAGAYQGQAMIWQDWMLISSHLAMAVEALLFVRLFRFGAISILVAALWTWLNDMVDYTYGVFPSLSDLLLDDLNIIALFTVALTGISVLAAWLAMRHRDISSKLNR